MAERTIDINVLDSINKYVNELKKNIIILLLLYCSVLMQKKQIMKIAI